MAATRHDRKARRLRIPERVLLARLRPADKLLVAATTGSGAISFRDLARMRSLPIDDHEVRRGIQRLERSGRLRVKRPTTRDPDTLQYDTPNSYSATHQDDDARGKNRGVLLPSVDDFDPGRSPTRHVLYAVCQREQMIAGLIATPLGVLAQLTGLGVTENAVKLAFREWKKQGRVRRVAGSNAYALDDPTYPPKPERFKAGTQRRHTVTGKGFRLRVWGTANQANEVALELARLGQPDVARRIVAALTPARESAHAATILDWLEARAEGLVSLEKVSQHLHPSAKKVSQHTGVLESKISLESSPVEDDEKSDREDRPVPAEVAATSREERHGFDGADGITSQRDLLDALIPPALAGPRTGGPADASATPRVSPPSPERTPRVIAQALRTPFDGIERKRRDYPDRHHTFLDASDQEAAELEELFAAVESKHGASEALFYWRQIVYERRDEHRGHAPDILNIYRARFGYLLDGATPNNTDVLASLSVFKAMPKAERTPHPLEAAYAADRLAADQPHAPVEQDSPASTLRPFLDEASGAVEYVDTRTGSILTEAEYHQIENEPADHGRRHPKEEGRRDPAKSAVGAFVGRP